VACVDVVDPTGKTTTYRTDDVGSPIVRASSGVYTLDVDTSAKPGRWQYRWWSPPGGSVQTAGAGEFLVSAFPAPVP